MVNTICPISRELFCALQIRVVLRGFITFLLLLLFGFHSFAADQCSTLFHGHRSSLHEYSAEMADQEP